MRFVYLDETGTGNEQVEPFVVVAGVMVDADKQWKGVERALIKLADAFALPEDRPNFCFHANELFTGGRKAFREKYSLQKRHDFLAALCELPEKFSLPVFMYAVNRAAYRQRRPGLSANELLTEELMHASINCATGVETFMRECGGPDEVATLIYEQNGDKSEAIREYHHFFRSELIEDVLQQLEPRRLLRFERIIETALHARKTDSSLLQIADTCAYVLGRQIRGAGIAERFYAPVRRSLVFGHRAIMQDGGRTA